MAKIHEIKPVFHQNVPRKKVAAYARVSVNTEDLLHSLSAQISHFNQLIQSNPDWEYVGVYVDQGISGKSIKHRTEFRRMITDCEAGKIDIVLTKSISRFARDTLDCLNTVRHLSQLGIEIRFEREGISTTSSDGELLLTLLASFAQAESESISANVIWATRKRFAEGIPNGHKAPYGYKWDGEMFRIIPEQGEVVKQIYRQYLAGDSAHKIAQDLKKQGIHGQRGAYIDSSTIKDILTSSSYMGTMVLQKHFFDEGHIRHRNKGELPRFAVEEMFEPLVSPTDFEHAVAIHQQRAEASPNANATPTRFSGLMKCGNCGCGLSRRTARNRKRWTCNTRERKGINACDMHPIQESELIEATEKALGRLSDGEFRSRVSRITVFGDRIEIDQTNENTKIIPRTYTAFNLRNGFSGKLFCAYCGAKLKRATVRNRNGTKVIYWSCRQSGKCGFHGIKESVIRTTSTRLLGTKNPEPAFVEQVQKATISNDSIELEMKNGEVSTCLRK